MQSIVQTSENMAARRVRSTPPDSHLTLRSSDLLSVTSSDFAAKSDRELLALAGSHFTGLTRDQAMADPSLAPLAKFLEERSLLDAALAPVLSSRNFEQTGSLAEKIRALKNAETGLTKRLENAEALRADHLSMFLEIFSNNEGAFLSFKQAALGKVRSERDDNENDAFSLDALDTYIKELKSKIAQIAQVQPSPPAVPSLIVPAPIPPPPSSRPTEVFQLQPKKSVIPEPMFYHVILDSLFFTYMVFTNGFEKAAQTLTDKVPEIKKTLESLPVDNTTALTIATGCIFAIGLLMDWRDEK